MASVSLKDIIAKMKLENLTPELDISKVKYNARNITGKQLGINLLFPCFRQPQHIRILHKADNLDTDCFKMFKIPCHLQSWPVLWQIIGINIGLAMDKH